MITITDTTTLMDGLALMEIEDRLETVSLSSEIVMSMCRDIPFGGKQTNDNNTKF
jgi:hypothetical protein